MADITTKIEQHKNLIQSVNGSVASIGLEKVGQKVAGTLVTPAVWVLNYSVQGSTPDLMDGVIYATSFISAPASITVGLIKSSVDDDIDNKLREVQKAEGKYAAFIKPCYRYGVSAPQINAASIAKSGGTAWRHPNGLWVYILDGRGHFVTNFQPRVYVEMYQPSTPLTQHSGGFKWRVIRKK